MKLLFRVKPAMLLLGFLTLLGFAVRCYLAHQLPIWLDEALSWRLAQMPWQVMWQRLQETGTVHPPLYFALLQLLIVVFGDTPIALRSFSVLCGTLLIPGSYWLTLNCLRGRANTGQHENTHDDAGPALLAACLVAFNPLQIHLACQARGYALASFWVMIASIVLLQVLHRDFRAWLGWSLYSTATVLAWYTHYLTILSSAAQWLYIAGFLFARYRWTGSRPLTEPAAVRKAWAIHQGAYFIVSVFVTVMIYAPWLEVSWQQLQRARVAWQRPITQNELLTEWGRAALGSFFDAPRTDLWWRDCLVVAVLVLASVWTILRVRPTGYFLLLSAWLPPLVLAIVSYLSPRSVFTARYFFLAEHSWLVLAALLAVDTVARWDRWLIYALLSLAMCMALAGRSDWRTLPPGMASVARLLEQQAQPDDVVVAGNPADFFTARYYLRRQSVRIFLYGPNPSRRGYRGTTHLLDEEIITPARLDELQPRRIWYLRSWAYGVGSSTPLPPRWREVSRQQFPRLMYLEGPIYVLLFDQVLMKKPEP